MGAKLSTQHKPDQLQALTAAEDAVLAHYGVGPSIATEEFIPIPNDLKEVMCGIGQLRSLQVNGSAHSGSSTRLVVVVLQLGGGMPSCYAPLFVPLSQIMPSNMSFWFVELPGHGLSEPFDYLGKTSGSSLKNEFAPALLESVRRSANVEQIDLVGTDVTAAMALWYATKYPTCVKSLTWLGAPACFVGQSLPFVYAGLGTWVGTQIMARPPPASVPTNLLFGNYYQSTEHTPDCMIELYRAMGHSQCHSLSWNYLMRTLFSNKKDTFFEWKHVEDVAESIPCRLIVGSSHPLLTNDQLDHIESLFGSENVVVGQGHMPYLEDASGVAAELLKAVTDA